MALPVLAGLAALLAALAGGRRAVWMVAGGVVLHLVLVALPVWRTPEDLKPPRLLDAPPLSLTVAPDLLAQPDFSTPEKAVMSVYDAACFGRIDVVKLGLSTDAIAFLNQKNGWNGFMDVYSGLRVVAVLKSLAPDGNSARVDGIVINRSGGNAGSGYEMKVVRENGEWRVASLHGLSPTDGRFDQSLLQTTARQTTASALPEKTRWQVRNMAIDGQPAESFELQGKLEAKSTRGDGYTAATVHVGGHPLFMIVGQGYFGGLFHWLSGDGKGNGSMGSIKFALSDENKATIDQRTYDLTRGRVFLMRPDGTLRQIALRPERVVPDDSLKIFVAGLPSEVAAENPGTIAPSTTEARLEGMEAQMNSTKPTPLQYRAACRIEVHLKRGDTKALLNEALGKFCKVVAVAAAKDQFDLVVTDPDPAQTSRLANYIGHHAEELLKEREIQGTVKILTPAERPEKPWIDEEASAVNDGNNDQAKFPKARKVDEDNDWAPWAEYLKDGDRRVALDDRGGALKSYRDGLAYVEKIQVNNPDALLSVQATCLVRIGDVLKTQGDFAKATENYRSSQTIVKKLLMRTPENAGVRDELTRIHVRIGDTQTATGDQLGAAKSYRDAVAVAEKLERNWETEYPNGSRGDDLARDYQAEETLRLIDKPNRDSWDLMWMIGQAGAIKDGRLRPLLERKDLLKDENLALALAGYDFSLNGNQKGLDFILAKLAEQRIGADVNEVIGLSFLDEWDRSIKAVNSHFLATDGAGGDCMNSFWGRRMLLFPRRYLEFKGKVTALPPEK